MVGLNIMQTLSLPHRFFMGEKRSIHIDLRLFDTLSLLKGGGAVMLVFSDKKLFTLLENFYPIQGCKGNFDYFSALTLQRGKKFP